MSQTITPKQMKELESRVMSGGVESETLMRRASQALCEVIAENTPDCGSVLFVCGCGNNGGDGLCAARLLLEKRNDIFASVYQMNGTLSQDCARERNRLFQEFGNDERLSICTEPRTEKKPEVVLDALFGTGLDRPLSEKALMCCEWINLLHERGAKVIGCDIPSGLNGTSGEVMGDCVVCDCTVSFHRAKQGLFLKKGPDVCGKVLVADIGLNKYPENDRISGMKMLTRVFLPKRKQVSNKGSYGRVLLLCGSFGMAGAAALCANAALRTGAGLCTIAAKREIIPVLQQLAPCATCLELPEDVETAKKMLLEKANTSDAVGMGCGLGQSEWARVLTAELVQFCSEKAIPCVVDADALNLMSGEQSNSESMGDMVYLTPHPGEAARLLGQPIKAILGDPLLSLELLERHYGCNVMLKGARTLMRDTLRDTAVNPFGTPALAKGGSGDALCGVLTSLLAGVHAGCYRMNSLLCMQTACALHELAGAEAEKRFGERGVLATDLTDSLGLDYSGTVLLREIEMTAGD